MTYLRVCGFVLAMALLGGVPAAAQPQQQASSCQLASGVQHVIYLQFDNVHFVRDNPNVPSDLLPNLPSFISRVCSGVEALPKTRPAIAGIFRGYAHAGGGADEPFNSEIGAWLPIAL